MVADTLRLVFVLVILSAASAGCGAPTSDERMVEAEAALASGEISTANIHLRNLLQMEPENVPARSMLAGVALALGDVAGAEQAARRAISGGADSAELRLTLLQALTAQRKFEEVIDEAAVAQQAGGSLSSIELRILGAAHQALGELEAAERVLRAAVAMDSTSPEPQTQLASVLLAAGNADEAGQIVAAVLRGNPEFVPALILRGTFEIQANRLELAEATFEEAAALATGNTSIGDYQTAKIQLVDLQLHRGDLAAAEKNADDLLSANPSSPLARMVKAKIEIEQGNLGSAEARLDSLLVDTPNYGAARALLGIIDARQDQLGQAEMNLTAALTTGGGDLARLQLAEVYVRQGKVEEARRLFEGSDGALQGDSVFLALAGGASLAVGDTDLAESFFAQSEQLDGKNAQDLTAIARIFVNAGQYDRAVRIIEATEFDGPNADLAPQFLTALVRLRQGEVGAAQEIAERLLAAEPSLSASHLLLGMIATYRQDPDAARGHFETALSIEPKNPSTLAALARIEVGAGNRDSAKSRLLDVVEIEPNHYGALQTLAEIALSEGDAAAATSWLERTPESALKSATLGNIELLEGNFAEAADAFSIAYEQQPTVELAAQSYQASVRAGRPNAEEKLLSWVARNPLDVRANFALGTAALNTNDLDQAIVRYETVLQFDPEHSGALNNLAWIYSQRDDDRALEYAQRAYAAAPDLAAVADTLGWIHYERGDLDSARPLLEEAAAAYPDQLEIQYHWGAVLAGTGASGQARDVLTKVLASGTDFSGRADAEQILQQLGSP
jgi:putative PEP-CTERM system TPR-repeat lipoprotein